MSFYQYQDRFINLDQVCSYHINEATEGSNGSSGDGYFIAASPPQSKHLVIKLADGEQFNFHDADLLNVSKILGIKD